MNCKKCNLEDCYSNRHQANGWVAYLMMKSTGWIGNSWINWPIPFSRSPPYGEAFQPNDSIWNEIAILFMNLLTIFSKISFST